MSSAATGKDSDAAGALASHIESAAAAAVDDTAAATAAATARNGSAELAEALAGHSESAAAVAAYMGFAGVGVEEPGHKSSTEAVWALKVGSGASAGWTRGWWEVGTRSLGQYFHHRGHRLGRSWAVLEAVPRSLMLRQRQQAGPQRMRMFS